MLRRFARRPLAGCSLTLLTPGRVTVYSGMVPGIVAGLYPAGAADIDVAGLARAAGARLLPGRAAGLDPKRQQVLRDDGPPLGYDLLSLDIGSGPNTGAVAGAAAHATAVKPVGTFLDRLAAARSALAVGGGHRLAVVGGGAAGVELTLALARQSTSDPSGRLALTLLAAPDLLPGFPAAARRRLWRELAACGVTVLAGRQVVEATADRMLLADGTAIAADAVLWASAAAAPSWLAGSGLALDPAGFVRVDATLRAVGQDRVFAAGDVAALEPGAVPHAGVYAVRAAPLLAHNLRAAAAGGRLRQWRPQRRALYILSMANRRAVAVRFGVTVSGYWAWRLKDWLDRRFVARLNDGAARSRLGQ